MRLIRQHVDCIKKRVQTICLDTWHFMHEIGADPYGLMVTVFNNTTTCKSVSPTLTHAHGHCYSFLYLVADDPTCFLASVLVCSLNI